MRIALPPSLQKERHTIYEEVAWAKTLTPEQRLHVVAALCRDVVTLLSMNPKGAEVLQMQDPVPDSTIKAMRRLKQQMLLAGTRGC